jgi:hypothetical protein
MPKMTPHKPRSASTHQFRASIITISSPPRKNRADFLTAHWFKTVGKLENLPYIFSNSGASLAINLPLQ